MKRLSESMSKLSKARTPKVIWQGVLLWDLGQERESVPLNVPRSPKSKETAREERSV